MSTANGHVLALDARDLVYRVEAARILDGASLQAGRGDLIGLIGPNGAGKTTLLKAMAGLLRHHGGVVSLTGRDLASLSAGEVARTLATVAQTPPYTYGFTAMEVVLMGRYPHLGRFQVEGRADHDIADDSMRQTETDQFAARTLTTLSGGERQRVFMARALAQQPQVLLLDEPTANLDILHQIKMLDLVTSLVAQGLTAVAAIHDLHLAARYCHRLTLLTQGRVLAEGRPEEVLTPDNIEAAFGVSAVVYPDPMTGALTLSLAGPVRDRPAAHGRTRVHLLCGGGTGARLMYELQRAGCLVTCGALGAGDTDRTAADILRIDYVPIPAFGAIDDQAHAAHVRLAQAADCVLVTDVPFGANNLRNLEAVAASSRVVCIEPAPFANRDFTGGAADRLYRGLSVVARCATVTDAVTAVRKLTPESPGAGGSLSETTEN